MKVLFPSAKSMLCHHCCTACAKKSWHSELRALQLVFLDVLYLNWPFLNPVMGWVHHSSQLFKTQPAQSNIIMKPSSFWRWNHMNSASKCDAAASGKCWACTSSPWKVLACMLFIIITSHWNTAESIARNVEWTTVVSSLPWSLLAFPEKGTQWAQKMNPVYSSHPTVAVSLVNLQWGQPHHQQTFSRARMRAAHCKSGTFPFVYLDSDSGRYF